MRRLLKPLLIYTLTLLCIYNSQAAPAYPHPITITLPDGSELAIKLYGDEFFSYALTSDGFQIIQKEDGFYYYYTPGIFSKAASSGELVRAANPSVRTRAEQGYLSTLRSGVDAQYLASGRAAAKLKREILAHHSRAAAAAITPPQAISIPIQDKHPAKGLVILAQYSDVKFQNSNTKATFEALLNQKGYSRNGAIGSAKDYFKDNSLGAYSPEFVVSQIITLPKNRAFYGANDDKGSDTNPAQMVRDACAAADNSINFAEFATNNPAKIDMVFVFYAGHNEAEGGPQDAVWPHRWTAGSYNTTGSLVFDGVTLYDYACTSELNGSQGANLCGIGTFVHEYSHVLGLADYYDTDYEGSGGETVGLYNLSTMGLGAYNSGGNIPPYYSSYDRLQVGWNSLRNIGESLGETTIYPTNTTEGNDAWIMETSTENEFFVIESRSNEKWDSSLEHTGLLIYHIDYSTNNSGSSDTYGTQRAYKRWGTNTINTNPTHPCVRFIESSAMTNIKLHSSQIFYPGRSDRTTFTTDDYGFKTWSGETLDYSLLNITNNNGEVTLVVEPNNGYGITTKQREAVLFYDYTSVGATFWTLKIAPQSNGTWKEHPNITSKSVTITNLEPNTPYKIQITPNVNNTEEIINYNFTTKAITANYAAIEVDKRNSILTATNLQEVPTKIEWYVNDTLLENSTFAPQDNTRYSIKCHITYNNGSGEIITKVINP